MATEMNLISSLIEAILAIEWKSILEEIGKTVVSLVILAYPTIKAWGAIFGKSFVTKFGEKIAEVSTSKIKTKIEETVKQSFRVELETLKASLNKENKTYEINYAKFQQKRFDVVVELYKKLAIMLSEASNYTKIKLPINSPKILEEKKKNFYNARVDLVNYLVLNKLFVDPKMVDALKNIINEINSKCKQYESCYQTKYLSAITEEESTKAINELKEIASMIPSKIEHIESEMRKLIFPEG